MMSFNHQNLQPKQLLEFLKEIFVKPRLHCNTKHSEIFVALTKKLFAICMHCMIAYSQRSVLLKPCKRTDRSSKMTV